MKVTDKVYDITQRFLQLAVLDDYPRPGSSFDLRLARGLCVLVIFLLLIISLSHFSIGGSASGAPGVVTPVKMIVPMYSDPFTLWPSMQGSTIAVSMVIFNPDVAMRFIDNASFAALISQVQGMGVQVLGYIPTAWDNGVVPLNYSETLMQDEAAWYHVNGFFMDDVNSTCAGPSFTYYTNLTQFAKQLPTTETLVMNLGGVQGDCYLGMANIFVTFEGSYSTYLNAPTPSWGAGVSPSRFVNMVYGVPNSTAMTRVVDLAIARNVGLVYVTDRDGNPYASLPSYMQQELAYVESLATTNTTVMQGATVSSMPGPSSTVTGSATSAATNTTSPTSSSSSTTTSSITASTESSSSSSSSSSASSSYISSSSQASPSSTITTSLLSSSTESATATSAATEPHQVPQNSGGKSLLATEVALVAALVVSGTGSTLVLYMRKRIRRPHAN